VCDVALGAGWSHNEQSANETIGGSAFPAPQVSSGDSSEGKFTYSVAPRLHLSTDTMLYARVASGYRPGGPNALPPGAPAGVPREYQADSTVNYELGTKTTLLDNHLSIDVAAFLIHWDKIQLLEDVENFGVNANGGTARSQGVEWTLGLTPATGLDFTLTGAYVDAYLTSDAPAAGGTDGDRLPYAPKWSNSLDGSYTWRAFGDFSALVGATWTYTGAQHNDFSASAALVGGAVVFLPNPRVELGGYNTVSLRVGLENPRWLFLLYCKNLGDVRGITNYVSQGTPNFGGSIALIQPRTIGATITARF